ncbi:hypothetical protein BH24CHL9_BH24CHL9_14460 [soil metagenome]
MRNGPGEADRVRLLREVLTATGAGIYLATHVAGPVPAEVAAAVRDSDDLELRLGRAGLEREEDLTQREREARAVVAAAVHADPERVVLSHGPAEAARLIALDVLGREASRPHGGADHGGATPSTPRGVIVVEGLDIASLEALRSVCAACRVALRVIPDERAVLPRDVALVAAAHVTGDGRVVDVARLARSAATVDARLVVDASLSVGAMALEVTSMGADAVIGATHRWLLGPEGVAFAWLGSALGDAPGRLRSAMDPFPRSALLALARSVGWLLMYAELPWVLERTERLTERCHTALSALSGVRLATSPGAHAALLALSIEGWSAAQAAEELSHSVFAILDANTERDLVRVGVGAWNREEELDRFSARVAELAAHTPTSLPRRPSLTILAAPGDDA